MGCAKMAGKSNVFESKATYYNPASKKWETGVFTLNKNFFQFVSDSNKSDQLHLYFPLSTISGIEKRQSSLIYAALVISIGSEKHWFASFPSRDCVYNLVELFWRESLLSRPIKTPSSPKAKANSALGKELLNILYESENTLVDAANTLSDQGRQLHEAQNELKDINEDVTVAEKFLKMHFSQAVMKMCATNPNVNETNQESERRTKKYKVTFSFSGISNDNNNWQKGTLVISDDVKLLDEQDHDVIQVTQDELETFQVLSPWELCITYSINSKIHSCYLMCPQLSRLLKFLSISSFKTKILFEDDTSSVYETASSSSSFGSPLASPSSSVAKEFTEPSSTSSFLIQENSVISEEEIEEISNVLNNLRALATEVGKEQENQMEKINSLLSEVDKTELRITNDNKKIKKMI